MCLGHVIHVFHHLLLRRRSGASRLKAAMLAMPARNFWISMSWPPLCRRGFPLAKNRNFGPRFGTVIYKEETGDNSRNGELSGLSRG